MAEMKRPQSRTREEAEEWILAFLKEQPDQAAPGSAIREAAEEDGFHDRTLRRAAAVLEDKGVMFRAHHGSREDRNVTWSLKKLGESCEACGHPKAVHGLRGLACRYCPSQACTKVQGADTDG